MRISTIVKVSMLSLCVSTLLYANKMEEKVNKLEDVIVTANKIEENLQKVPQSISVLDKEIIEEKGIKDIVDVINQIPNMTNHEVYGHSANFRGLNTSMFTGNNPIVIYVDGVPMMHRYSFDVPLANVERIEVLRGPQGTLYGKDAIGAVINIITKKPKNVANGNIGLEYSSFNTIEGQFNVSSPIIEDKFFFGLNASGKKSDGWITNTYNNDDSAAGYDNKKIGTYLLVKPTDNLSIRLNLAHDGTHKNKALDYGILKDLSLSDIKRKDLEKQAWDIDEKEDTTTNSQALNIEYDLDKFELVSITTNKKTKVDAIYDADFSTGEAYKNLNNGSVEEDKEFTQELRISNKDKKIKWVGGLYFDTGKNNYLPQYMQTPMPNDPTNPALGFTNIVMADYVKQKHKSMALFAQVKFPVAEKLDLTVGGRLQKIKKEIKSDFYMYPVSTALPNTSVNPYIGKKTWNSFLPKLALSYKLNNSLMPYISLSKGYMPGGFNYFAMEGGEKENTFEPQTSTNYELGIKGRYDDFSFGANVFRMDIKNIHVFKVVGQSWHTSNAKKAHSQGLEFDFNYLPTNEIEISGAFGYIDAKYDDYDLGTKKLDGERIEVTPKFSANLGVAYYHESGIYGRIDARALGKTSYYASGKQAMEKIGNAFFADIKLGYRVGSFDIYGFVKNLTNEERITSHGNDGQQVTVAYNDPRTFGLGIKYDF